MNSNNTSYPLAIYRHFRPARQETTASDLFFISLPNRQNLAPNTTVTPTAVRTIAEGGVNQHENLAYLHDDDEPPSYYDAVLVKDLRLPIAKDDNSSSDNLNSSTNTDPAALSRIALENHNNDETNENTTI